MDCWKNKLHGFPLSANAVGDDNYIFPGHSLTLLYIIFAVGKWFPTARIVGH
jgi:hypothetical protein